MDATTKDTTTTAKFIPIGIHFGLDEETYHRDSALGSSDIRNLRLSAPDFWWNSGMNPHRDEDENDDTPAKIRGRAMHKLVLEGEAGFDRLYMRIPRPGADLSPSEKGAITKAANATAKAKNLTALPAKDYDRIAIAAAMISKNPKLKTVFQNGASEVSVFWIRDGVRCKARFDYLKAGGIGDLKSITNMKKIEFRRACREAIANWRYDIQAAHYLDGRAQMAKLFADGLVFGDHDDALLKKVVAAKQFAFQFVFFQADKAPVTWSTILSPQNPMIEVAGNDVTMALENFKAFMAEFGPDNIWLLLDEPRELEIEAMPAWWARNG